jgi:hypothetical protein
MQSIIIKTERTTITSKMLKIVMNKKRKLDLRCFDLTTRMAFRYIIPVVYPISLYSISIFLDINIFCA